MKKVTILLAALMLASSTVGCGCCRRIGDLFNRGAYCGPSAVATPTYVAPVAAPAPTPMVIPQASYAPACCPCEPCCDPCGQPCCETYGYGATPMEYTGGVPTYDSGWSSGCDSCGGVSGTVPMTTLPGTIGTVPSTGIDPGPVPAGP
ncbi:MAG: hypothetical protein AAF589_06920 [Planctomycetota bacterium]